MAKKKDKDVINMVCLADERKLVFKVVRTHPNDTSELELYLQCGFRPQFATKIGRDVEYIVYGFEEDLQDKLDDLKKVIG